MSSFRPPVRGPDVIVGSRDESRPMIRRKRKALDDSILHSSASDGAGSAESVQPVKFCYMRDFKPIEGKEPDPQWKVLNSYIESTEDHDTEDRVVKIWNYYNKHIRSLIEFKDPISGKFVKTPEWRKDTIREYLQTVDEAATSKWMLERSKLYVANACENATDDLGVINSEEAAIFSRLMSTMVMCHKHHIEVCSKKRKRIK